MSAIHGVKTLMLKFAMKANINKADNEEKKWSEK